MLRHGEPPDRHPVELFGEAVVNRIFAGAEDWHWRRLVSAALIGLAFTTALFCAIFAQMQGAVLYSWCAGAIALLAVGGALYLWRDHRELSVRTLQFCAETEEQHRWLDRLDDHLRDLRNGTILVLALDADTGVRQSIPASVFADNNGRILLLDSRFDETRRAYRKPPEGRIVVSVPGTEATNSPAPPAESSPPELENLPPETDSAAPAIAPDISSTAAEHPLPAVETNSPDHEVHHLHGLTNEEFEQLLAAYLATKKWDEDRKEEFRAIQRVTHALVQSDPCMGVGAIMKELPTLMLGEHQQKLTLQDESVSKMVGYSNNHQYSEFRNFVRGRTDQTRRK